jgi:two-component system LytT family response regulator
MIRALIIDDAEKARIALRSDIEKYCPDLKIVGEAQGVSSGLEAIERYKPELVFLDIQMSDGTGFELLEKLKREGKISFRFVFTTAFDEYAIKAFKYSAIDYLLKPIDPADLIQSVEKVKEASKPDELKESLEILLGRINKTKDHSARIALNSSDKIQLVTVGDIVRCESQGNYTLFYLNDQKQILVSRTLKEFEDLLEEHDFIRIHNSHLINPKYLREFIKTESYVLMKDNSQVPVSVRKKDLLMKHLGL